jgi:hypothetical protein
VPALQPVRSELDRRRGEITRLVAELRELADRFQKHAPEPRIIPTPLTWFMDVTALPPPPPASLGSPQPAAAAAAAAAAPALASQPPAPSPSPSPALALLSASAPAPALVPPPPSELDGAAWRATLERVLGEALGASGASAFSWHWAQAQPEEPVVVHVRCAHRFQVLLCLPAPRAPRTPLARAFRVDRCSVFAANEDAEPLALSRHAVFVKVQAQVACGSEHFAAQWPLDSATALLGFLHWLASYQSLFSAVCAGCQKHLQYDSDRLKFLPPTARHFATRQPFHPHCLVFLYATAARPADDAPQQQQQQQQQQRAP